MSLFFHEEEYVCTNHGMLNFVRDDHCLLNLLIQAGRRNVGGWASSTALVRDGRGRGHYRPACGDSLAHRGRSAGQGRPLIPFVVLTVALCLCLSQRQWLCLRHIFLRLGLLERGFSWLHGRRWPRIHIIIVKNGGWIPFISEALELYLYLCCSFCCILVPW